MQVPVTYFTRQIAECFRLPKLRQIILEESLEYIGPKLFNQLPKFTKSSKNII